MALNQTFNSCGLYALGFDGTDMNATLYTGVVIGEAPEGMVGTEGAALVRPASGQSMFGVLQSYGPQGEPTEVSRSGICPVAISEKAAGGKIGQKLSVGEDGFFVEATGSSFDCIACAAYEPGAIVTADIGK